MSLFSSISDLFGDATALAPIIVLLIGAILVPFTCWGKNRKAAPAVLALIAVIIAFVINAIFLTEEVPEGIWSYDLFVVNTFTSLMTALFLVVAALVVFVSYNSVEVTKNKGVYYSLLLIATVGMVTVAQSTNLLMVFVGVECVSITSYALVTMKKNDPRASEAGVKYLIIGGLSSALTLFGLSLMYGIFGTLNFSEIWASTNPLIVDEPITWSTPLVISLACLIAGWGFKISSVPFHAWAPDVYEGAATPVSAFLAVGSKKMGFVVFMKMFVALIMVGGLGINANCQPFQIAFGLLAAATMTLGNIVAIQQTNIKRMLAYSSIAQAGYIMIALAVMTPYAMAAGMFHMFTHVIMKGGAFVVVIALINAGLGENISNYKGLAKRAPVVAFAMLLFLFSLAGIPPLAGFTSKFFLFSSTVINGVDGFMWVWLLLFAVINSAISLYYYAKVVKAMYVDKGETTAPIKVGTTFMIAIVICAVMVIVLGLYPDLVFDWCTKASELMIPLI